MSSTQYEQAREALERDYGPGKPNGKETRYRCPAHDDQSPSLDVAQGADGKAIFQCRSRHCTGEAILKALNLKPSANGAANGKPAPRKIVATYDYRDESGTLLFQSVRYDPKDFRQRRPLGAGQYEWSITGCRKVPYRLPELKAAPQDCQVFIVEGEKDVDALRALGFVATCNPMGAGKWNHVCPTARAECFKDRRVIILPDNDEPGRKHANDVCQSLRTLASEIVVLELPGLKAKGDVSDWIQDGGNAEQLRALAESQGVRVDLESDRPYWQGESHDGPEDTEAPKGEGEPQCKNWKPSPIDSATFANGDYRHEWLAKKLLVRKEPCIVFGPSKTLKTSIIVDLAISLATGSQSLNFFDVPHPRRVLLISGESGPASLQSVAKRVCESRGINLADVGEMLKWEFSVPPLSDDEALSTLRKLLEKHLCEVLVIDPAYLALLTGGTASADSASNMFSMGPLLSRVVQACKDADAQLLLVHHCNKKIAIGDEPDLSHIAYTGFEQFARQWIGINRLEPFSHDGQHKLVMVAGGSAGHGGKWVVAINEGQLDEDFTGRRWDVSTEPFVEAVARDKQEKRSAKEEKREAQVLADLLALKNAVRDLSATAPEGAATRNKLKGQLTSWSGDKMTRMIERAKIDGVIEERPIVVATGHDGKCKKSVTGFSLTKTDTLYG